MYYRTPQSVKGVRILGNGISIPRLPKENATVPARKDMPDCIFHREGNRAIPIQHIYEDDDEEDSRWTK